MEESINQRIKKARTFLKLSQDEIAEAINKKVSAISKIESGSQSVTPELITFYYRKGISPEWLLTGEGDMFKELPDLVFDPNSNEYKKNSQEEPIPFVPLKAYFSYPSSRNNESYISALPRFIIPIPDFNHRDIRAFEVSQGGGNYALHSGSIVLACRIKHIEVGKLDIGKRYVFVTENDIQIKKFNEIDEDGYLSVSNETYTFKTILLDISEIKELWEVRAAIIFKLPEFISSKMESEETDNF